MTSIASGHVKYPVNVETFLREDALSFYLLGVFLTDGNIERISGNKSGLYRIGLSSKDEDWIKLIRDHISPGRTIWKRKDQQLYRIELSNQQIAQWFLFWGCKERKSTSVEFPAKAPDAYLPDLVRGIFDGDGSLTVGTYKKEKNGRIYHYPKVNAYICSGSREFIAGLNRRLQSIGFSPSCLEVYSKEHESIRLDGTIKKFGSSTNWRLQFADRSALPFLRWMYYPGNPLSMPRKAELAEKAGVVFQKS